MTKPLVSTQWLADHITQSNLIVLDVSMARVGSKTTQGSPGVCCIPGALRLDMDVDFCDRGSEQLRAFPTTTQFADTIQGLGIHQDSTVVIYDHLGIYASPRAWWICHVMGLSNVFILDGGLPKWISDGHAVSKEYAQPSGQGDVVARPDLSLVCDASFILNDLETATFTVVDVRSEGRFYAREPEPRKGVRGGHIPNSMNIPYAQVLKGHVYKDVASLESLFTTYQLNVDQPLVFSCGSGLTACIVLIAAIMAGFEDVRLYDGSWADWGSNNQLPVAI